MNVNLEVTDKKIRELVLDYVRGKLGATADVKLRDIHVKVRSKQNYRNHEWEDGELQVRYEGEI